jgi:hypothetical protein
VSATTNSTCATNLKKSSRTQILVTTNPPVRRAACRAACTQHALIQSIELLSILDRLGHLGLACLLFGSKVQPRLDAGMVSVELAKIANKIFQDWQMWKWVDLYCTAVVERRLDALLSISQSVGRTKHCAIRLVIVWIQYRETSKRVDTRNAH